MIRSLCDSNSLIKLKIFFKNFSKKRSHNNYLERCTIINILPTNIELLIINLSFGIKALSPIL